MMGLMGWSFDSGMIHLDTYEGKIGSFMGLGVASLSG